MVRMDILAKFKEEVVEQLASATGINDIEGTLLVPKSREFGNLTTNICFMLAKKTGRNPSEIAKELSKKIHASEFISKVEASGQYVNFFINEKAYLNGVIDSAMSESYGKGNKKEGKIIVEYSSPNIAKPFGVAHLRSTIIGDSIYRCYDFLGYDCERVNHFGDWGTQFGKLITAYKKWGDDAKLREEPIKECLNLYVKFHQEAEKDKMLEEEARAWFKKLEDGDNEAVKLWKYFKDLSIENFKRIYAILGVSFDSYTGESFYATNALTKEVLSEAESKKVSSRDKDNSVIVNLEEDKLGIALLVKSDGASLYMTRDLAAAKYRWEHYRFLKNIYVVGADQELYFKQLFNVLKRLGNEWVDRCYHVKFGMILSVDGGKMSTRKGKVIFLEDVLNKAVEEVESIMRAKNPDMPSDEMKRIARSVGIGAIKFADLHEDRKRAIKFDWDHMFDAEGDTGPYIQYAFARTSKILSKSGTEISAERATPSHADEIGLAYEIAKFPDVIIAAADKFEINAITNYLLVLCHSFSRFYESCPIINAENENSKALRLALTKATRNILKNGLYLLGMDALDNM